MTPEKTVTYGYTDTLWKDVMTSYDGQEITYDELGNPLSYRGMTFTWENARELASITKDGVTYQYRYNQDGMRNRKYLSDGTVYYQIEGDLIVGEQKIKNGETESEYELEYIYDSSGNVIALLYNGIEYYYVKNLQGDITGIANGAGEQVVTYVYDTWGRVIKTTTALLEEDLGALNPFRYRGYYYDSESGLYYLNNRFYDSEVGRFISADTTDVLTASTKVLTDKNLYAYCDNNPVMRMDAGGEFWTIASGAVIGAVISAGIEFGMQLATGGKIDVVNIGIAALGGAAGGALAATSLGWRGQIIGNAAISAVTEIVSQVKNGNSDLGSIAQNARKMAVVGAASVAFGGRGIKAKGSAYRNSLDNLNSVKGNVSKAISNPKGYRHQINRAIKIH